MLTGWTAPAKAGQIPSHACLAQRIFQALPQPIHDVIKSNLLAYMTGSAGPDVAGVGSDIQGTVTVGKQKHGWEAHLPPHRHDLPLPAAQRPAATSSSPSPWAG